MEFLIAKNNVILSDLRNYESGQSRGNENNNYDFFNQCEYILKTFIEYNHIFLIIMKKMAND